MSTKTKATKAKTVQARMVNIPRSVGDDYYRYKMPELVIKVEGVGNGIKTVLVNASDVAKALARPSPYIVKYLALQLGAMSIIKEADDKYVLNGKHSQVDLMKLLDQFIAKYVLCRKCENPETTIEIRRDTISLTCKACGEVTQFPVLDKFDTYISKLAASAKPAKVKKAPAAAPASDETASDTSAAAAGDEKKKKVLKKKVVPGKKVTKTPSAFTANLPVYSIESEIDVALASLDRGSSVEMLAGELRKIYDSLGDHRNCEHMARAIFSTVFNGDIAARIMAAGSVLAPYTAARQNVQFAVMGLLNTALAAKDLVPATVPGILKKFYDDDVLAEENVLAWVDANPDTPLTKAAEPFVNWLKTAETED